MNESSPERLTFTSLKFIDVTCDVEFIMPSRVIVLVTCTILPFHIPFKNRMSLSRLIEEWAYYLHLCLESITYMLCCNCAHRLCILLWFLFARKPTTHLCKKKKNKKKTTTNLCIRTAKLDVDLDLLCFFLSCVCYVFVRVCLYVLCGHLMGKC